MTRQSLAALVIVMVGAISVPAKAQYAIINDVIAMTVANMTAGQPCTAMPEKEIAEARDPAPGIMARYFAAASGGGAKSAMFKLNGNTKWTAGAIVAGAADIDKQRDPLAVAENSLISDPLRFYRAGTFGTALGQWSVRGASGTVVGVYTARFERESRVWKLRELKVSTADEVVEPVAPYCNIPGDTTGQRVTATADYLSWTEKQLGKRKAKHDAAQATAAAAKGGTTAKTLRDTASREAKKLQQAEDMVAKAREAHAKAVADAAEIKRLTLPARDAEQFRQKDEPAASATN